MYQSKTRLPRSRSVLAGILTIPLLAAGVTACGHQGGHDWDQMCVDPRTQMRMPDYYCQPGAYYHPSWVYFVPYGYHAPAYNQHVTNYTINNYHRPANAHIHTDPIPSTGGKVTKPFTTRPTTSRNGRTGGGTTIKPKSRSGGGYRPPSVRRK